jgi:hypothetical protein
MRSIRLFHSRKLVVRGTRHLSLPGSRACGRLGKSRPKEPSVHHLAFYAVNVLREPLDSPAMCGLVAELDAVLDSARRTHGCLWVAVGHHAPALPQVTGPTYSLATISLWEDAEAALAFAFHFTGRHGIVMRRRNEWLVPFTGPMYAAWWVPSGHIPSWDDAVARIEHLRAHGSTACAFNFGRPFRADGRPLRLDQARINARRQTVR